MLIHNIKKIVLSTIIKYLSNIYIYNFISSLDGINMLDFIYYYCFCHKVIFFFFHFFFLFILELQEKNKFYEMVFYNSNTIMNFEKHTEYTLSRNILF